MMREIWIWAISGIAIAGILFRPKDWPEAVWAMLSAGLLILFQYLSLGDALRAAIKGLDVYLFLIGMMLLSEVARREGVFRWLAHHAVESARGSKLRLFTILYIVGIFVTIFLSNDATAVVLTPAVYAAVKKAEVNALPYLFICAFIANAASFVLPISNPANLVVYGNDLPTLLPWLKLFLFPSLVSIVVTYGGLRFLSRRELHGHYKVDGGIDVLSSTGRRAAMGIVLTGLVLIGASARGFALGLPTLVAAALTVLITIKMRARALQEIIQDLSWSMLPLVAGLFVVVEGLNRTGALEIARWAIQQVAGWTPLTGALTSSFAAAALSNMMNNLPSGLMAGQALHSMHLPDHLRHAFLLGIDLGPNLSVTGSLAAVLWLIALRREGFKVSGWEFLKTGAWVMPPALLLSTLALLLSAR